MGDWVSRPWGYTEQYQIDSIIAKRIKAMFLGAHGLGVHSYRAISLRTTGFEDQMAGMDLVKCAAWSLDENVDDWYDTRSKKLGLK